MSDNRVSDVMAQAFAAEGVDTGPLVLRQDPDADLS
jgi:hypothetical protein